MDLVHKATVTFAFILTTAMAFAVNPGFKMRLTENGIAYANSIAEVAIQTRLRTVKIPDQSGKDHGLQWSLTNIQIRSVSGPNSQITLNPGQSGLTWVLASLSLSLHADWHAKYRHAWIKISDGGSVDVNVDDASMSVTVALGQKDGRPSVSTESCNDHIGNVGVHFHGGSAFIWNLFKRIVEDKIKAVLQKRICETVSEEVNVDAEEALSRMKVYIEIDHRFLLDYSLVAPPSITSTYLDTFNKGEVFWKADKQEAPFTPGAIPPSGDISKMLYLWVTEYTANTFGYVAHNHGYLKYNVTKDKLPGDHSEYLNTTCKSMCIGKLLPQIAKMYPNSWVELRINSTSAPAVKITSQGLSVAAYGDVEMVAHTPEGTTPSLLTLNVSLSLTASASVVNEKLTASITGPKLDVGVLQSNIGPVDARNLNMVLNGALDFVIIPELNRIGKAGVDLPVTGDIRFKNTQLTLLDGVLLIVTDLEYLKSLRFIAEPHP